LTNALLEIEKIINGALIRNEKNSFKKMLKDLNKLKKRFGNVKKELEKHKERWNHVPDSNFAINIETFNNYKKMLIDEKDLIITQGQNNVKNQIENLKSNLLKNIIKDLESFYDCLKIEYDVLTFDFNILNDLLHW
jgi:archaellum component FlaC